MCLFYKKSFDILKISDILRNVRYKNMSEKSKKGISLTGILTLVNIVLVIGIALLFYFGPAGAKANAKGALDFAIYCITLFQVNAGGFAISSVAIVLALASALAVLIILVLFVLYLARKAWKSLSAVFSLLLSTALFKASIK